MLAGKKVHKSDIRPFEPHQRCLVYNSKIFLNSHIGVQMYKNKKVSKAATVRMTKFIIA